jgi:hypothetical protein
LAKNSSFGFSAVDFVLAKTKCSVCAAGFFRYETQRMCKCHSSGVYIVYIPAQGTYIPPIQRDKYTFANIGMVLLQSKEKGRGLSGDKSESREE